MNQSDTANRRSFEMAKKLEPNIANQFQAVVALSKEDRSYLLELGCKTKIHVIPPQIKKIPQLIDIIKKSPLFGYGIGDANEELYIEYVDKTRIIPFSLTNMTYYIN